MAAAKVPTSAAHATKPQYAEAEVGVPTCRNQQQWAVHYEPPDLKAATDLKVRAASLAFLLVGVHLPARPHRIHNTLERARTAAKQQQHTPDLTASTIDPTANASPSDGGGAT